MNKKDFFINVSPFLLWIAFFVLELVGFGNSDSMFIVRVILILGLPLVVSIYNSITSKDCGDIMLKNTFLTTAYVLGIVFSAAFSNSFIQEDPELEPVLGLGVGLALVYMGVLTLICCVVKRLVRKK